MKIEDGVGGHQVMASEKMEAGFKGRPTKGIERTESKSRHPRRSNKTEDEVEGRQAREHEKIDGGERRHARGSRQSRLAWMGDGGRSEEANGVGMCSPVKRSRLLFEKPPSHASIPPHQNGTMAKDGC